MDCHQRGWRRRAEIPDARLSHLIISNFCILHLAPLLLLDPTFNELCRLIIPRHVQTLLSTTRSLLGVHPRLFDKEHHHLGVPPLPAPASPVQWRVSILVPVGGVQPMCEEMLCDCCATLEAGAMEWR